jgi:type III restriction enzyme
MTLKHLDDVRQSTVLFRLTQHLLYSKFRDPGGEPKLHLFGQLKRIAKQWIDSSLICTGGTYPALLMYQDLADLACNRIVAGITEATKGRTAIKVLLDPYNPMGSTAHVRFNTSKQDRWSTTGPPPKNHVNWVILDSDWEAEFCRVAESHPRVIAYTKNHNLGFEVPYRDGSESRKYRPDFIVLVDDGRGSAPMGSDAVPQGSDPIGASNLLHLVVETKGYLGENAKDKKITMESYWIPGVNRLGAYGRWAFLELTDVFEIEREFGKLVDAAAAVGAPGLREPTP